MSFAQWMVADVSQIGCQSSRLTSCFCYLRAIGMRWPWKPWRHLIKSQELSLEIPDFWNGNYSQARFTKQYVTCAWCPLAFLREPGIISLEEGGKRNQGSNNVQNVQVATGLVDDLFPTILKFRCCDKKEWYIIYIYIYISYVFHIHIYIYIIYIYNCCIYAYLQRNQKCILSKTTPNRLLAWRKATLKDLPLQIWILLQLAPWGDILRVSCCCWWGRCGWSIWGGCPPKTIQNPSFQPKPYIYIYNSGKIEA